MVLCTVNTHFSVPVSSQTDTLKLSTIREVVVRGKRTPNYLKQKDGVSTVDMTLFQELPRILGNADPMHYTQLLPGVQTNNESDAGLHVQGCDNGHNLISIDAIPLYNVSHLMGLFSVFNATHFSSMQLLRTSSPASCGGRLGGELNVCTSDTIVRRWGGDISVGPMSSQATLRIPVSKKLSLTVSARESYLNLLYSKWLVCDGQPLKYGFGDYNLLLNYRPTDRDNIQVEAYYGHDNIQMGNDNYLFTGKADWGNRMAALKWSHRQGQAIWRTAAYYTAYDYQLNLLQQEFNLNLKADIYDIGLRSAVEFGPQTGTAGRWLVGLAATRHSIRPQSPEMYGTIGTHTLTEPRQNTAEIAAFAQHRWQFLNSWLLTSALRTTTYIYGASTRQTFDPDITVNYAMTPLANASLKVGMRHQHLYQTGFSSIGMPTEFWFSSGADHSPQRAYYATLSGDVLLHNSTYRLSAEVYYKRLYNQVEYFGNAMDFLYDTYSLESSVKWGNGYNYGIGLQAEKRKGALTGWVSYTWGRAMRRFPGTTYEGTYPANHERIHELNAVATYRLNGRWSFGATMVAASGTPYTKIKHAYIIAHNIVTDFGEHNAERVPMTFRLDLSVNFGFKCKPGRRSGINLSLYNVTMHENVVTYQFIVDSDNQMAYRPFSYGLKMLPSLNYYYSF